MLGTFSRSVISLLGVIVCLTPFALVPLNAARADSHAVAGKTIDEEQLIQRIKEELMKELREGDLIRKQVDAAMAESAKRQQEAKRAQRAERRRLASEKAKNVRRVSSERDHIYGNPDANVTIIEYSDFECPYCKRFHATPKQLVDASDGKVNWVYRHFPLGFHNPGAQKQAEASECAAELGGNDAFWKYTDELYRRTRSGGKGFPLSDLTPMAAELGLDAGQFKKCLDSERHAARVKEDMSEGKRSGITGTPGSILLNNKTGEVLLRAGALSLSSLQAAVSELSK